MLASPLTVSTCPCCSTPLTGLEPVSSFGLCAECTSEPSPVPDWEDCGYCGVSLNPHDICSDCFDCL